ncbi:MAG: hypothetical protein Q9215_001747 [Flavoplaca cf. flavocitrina]
MATQERITVATCIAAIIRAHSEGADLLAKIRGKRSARSSVQNGSVQEISSQELQASLNRGVEVIQSQFGRDASRFGEQYEIGDLLAREGLKDVIQLQDQMILDLDVQSYQESISDFSGLQHVSDSIQDRVVLLLLQLQQRVIRASPIEPANSLSSSWDPYAPTNQKQDHKTIRNVKAPPATVSVQLNAHYRELPALPPSNLRNSLETLTHEIVRSLPEHQECSNMKPSSHDASIKPLPPPPAHKTPSPPMRAAEPGLSDGPTQVTNSKSRRIIFGSLGISRKDPLVSSNNTTRSPESSVLPPCSKYATQGNLGPVDASIQGPSDVRANTAASISTQDTLERRSQTGSSSTGDSASISGDHPAESTPWSALANQDAKSFVSSSTSHTSEDIKFKRRSLKQPIAPQTITVITANQDYPSATDLLPSEANKYSGFCKGAWRLQIGDHKKALQERQRPGSMYSAHKFWQCKFCSFEGRLVQQDKKTSQFDQQIMSADGIQFRWVFLFKSHVECKDTNPNPLKSAFGCMFCCAEGRGTPSFRGAQALMDHLQEHRIRVPVGEVLYRMNACVGDEAPVGADWDINLEPKEGLTI